MNESKTIASSQSVECSFPARNVTVSNGTGAWVYLNINSQSIPDATHYDLAAEPFTIKSFPVRASKFFGIAIGTAFLPTSTAQGASIQIVFEDVPRSPSVANISAPGAAFQATYTFQQPVIAGSGSATLIAPMAGKKIYVFLIKMFSDPTQAGVQSYDFYHTTAPDIIILTPATLTGAGGYLINDELNALPLGFPLPIGKGLYVLNEQTGACQPGIFVLYNYT